MTYDVIYLLLLIEGICFFQKTVVKVYHILKKTRKKVSKWTTDKTNALAEVADISFDNASLLRSQKIY